MLPAGRRLLGKNEHHNRNGQEMVSLVFADDLSNDVVQPGPLSSAVQLFFLPWRLGLEPLRGDVSSLRAVIHSALDSLL